MQINLYFKTPHFLALWVVSSLRVFLLYLILKQQQDIAGGVKALAEESSRWLGQPELLVRAARHYEGAAQILIRHAVMTARQVWL